MFPWCSVHKIKKSDVPPIKSLKNIIKSHKNDFPVLGFIFWFDNQAFQKVENILLEGGAGGLAGDTHWAVYVTYFCW